jgi:formylglycine-generating enzyme required for sulfatase activity
MRTRVNRRRSLASLAPVWCALALGLGCRSSASLPPTRIDVAVDVDAALQVKNVTLSVTAPGRSAPPATMSVGDASGTPPRVPRIHWEIVIPDVTAPFDATVSASSTSGSDTIITSARAAIAPGRVQAVTLHLSTLCKGMSCTAPQTCQEGTCGEPPLIGPPDGGADSLGDGTDAPAASANGATCTSGSECASTYCVDKICCDKPCSDVCHSCKGALTKSLPDGTCGPVAIGGADSAGRCPTAAASPCGNTGFCDGKAACQQADTTVVCAAASCASGSFSSAAACDGAGHCGTPMVIDCKGAACTSAQGCATVCGSDTDCPGGYCTAAKTCSIKQVDGSPCAGNNECSNGHCVDKVCCNTDCTAVCTSCTRAGNALKDGACLPILNGSPSGGRCAKDTAPCGHDGMCDGVGGCRFALAMTVCAPPSCTGSTLTKASTCDGLGACNGGATAPCAASFKCASPTACVTTCGSSADCVAGTYCRGACQPTIANGGACQSNDSCTSGICSAGICCNMDCSKTTCYSCDGTLTGRAAGTCYPVASGGSSSGACMASGLCGMSGNCDGTGKCQSAVACGAMLKCDPTSGGCIPLCQGVTCGANQKCVPATGMCVSNCQGVTCSANQTCDPPTGSCVDICASGGAGTPTHCCSANDCPAATPSCNASRVCEGRCAGEPGNGKNCGPGGTDDCCKTLAVPGGQFIRNYDGVVQLMTSYTATVSAFNLDRYPVTVGRFRSFLNAGGGTSAKPPAAGAGVHPKNAGTGWDPAWNANLVGTTAELSTALNCNAPFFNPPWTAAPGANEHQPITCLTWYEAFAFCAWDGGRLPTYAESNFASSGGSDQRFYPWSVPPMAATVDTSYAVYCPLGGCKGPADVGTKSPKGDARWLQADLTGNVSHFVLDAYGSLPLPCVDCVNFAGSARAIRGGDFSETDPSFVQSVWVGSIGPTTRDVRFGVRCAR